MYRCKYTYKTQIRFLWYCDGPTLLRSDPSYPGGTDALGASDPDVLWAGTNHIPLPGDGRERQRIRAVTGTSNGNEDEDRWSEEGDGRNELSGAADGGSEGREEKGSGRYGKNSFNGGQSETSREDRENITSAAGRHRGPGGHTPELRPRSGKSVAPAGAWAKLSGTREVEGRIKDGEGGKNKKGMDTNREL
ncbi:hypothetical protein NDU88_006920 [Pleurodeles waltl]|uniref:Uncharacterized protein n=1 Tax=Pleurodeles waltl TaxID=8319 RepID=A0AAV7U1H7_PLEWA|nr:hypothetical protein NDU88_006920 [Pleurodeles waltl]